MTRSPMCRFLSMIIPGLVHAMAPGAAVPSTGEDGAPAPVIEIDPAPSGMPHAPFEVHVRGAGDGGWRDLFVHHAESMSKHPAAFGGAEGFVTFALSGSADVRITVPGRVRDAVVRPSLRAPVAVETGDRTVTVHLPGPRYVTVEINGPGAGREELPRYTLHLLADAANRAEPAPTDPDVRILAPGHHPLREFDPGEKTTVRLSPGVHTVEGDVAPLHSGKTLHLAGGAVLRARIRADDVRDARLTGRGIIDGSPFPRDPGDWRGEGEQAFVFLRRGDGILIDGPLIYNSPYWNIVAFGTRRLTIRNHKAITWKVNNDGVQPRSCTDLLVENCFLKCADDCIAIKTRRAAGMESRRLVFRDLVLWNDLPGNPMEIGHTSQADLLEDVVFRDIDVIHGEGGHTISMCIIDHSTVRNVRYENIFVEGVRNRDIGLRVSTSRYTTDDERGRIQGVVIRNYRTDGPPRGGEITGFSAEHLVEDVRIIGFTAFANDPVRRQVLRSADAVGLTVRHARDIRVMSSETEGAPRRLGSD